MPTPLNSEIEQLIQDFTRDLSDNIDPEDLLPVLVRLLKEIELDAMHGHEDNFNAFQMLLNDLGGEIQERLNTGNWTDLYYKHD